MTPVAPSLKVHPRIVSSEDLFPGEGTQGQAPRRDVTASVDDTTLVQAVARDANALPAILNAVRPYPAIDFNRELAYKVLWACVRVLSSRLRSTNDSLRSFLAMSMF